MIYTYMHTFTKSKEYLGKQKAASKTYLLLNVLLCNQDSVQVYTLQISQYILNWTMLANIQGIYIHCD